MTLDEPAVVFADPSGKIRLFSPGAERLFGHSAASTLGQSLDLIVPPDFRARHWEKFHQAMKTAECRLDRAAANLPVLCRDGQVRLFPGRFTFVTDAHGKPAGALAVYGEPTGREKGPFSPVVSD